MIYTQLSHRIRPHQANAGVAQLVEQLICNQQVAGSSPIASFSRIKNNQIQKPEKFHVGVDRVRPKMKISELRKLLREYEQTWYLRKLICDHEEAIKIRQYLKTFEDKLDDYELTASDLFDLIKIISQRNNLQLIQSIRSHFSSNYFFEIFNTLNDAGLINENNFPLIYDFPYDRRSLLYNLFCGSSPTGHLELRQEVLEVALALSNRQGLSAKIIKKCFALLGKRNLLNETGLKFLVEKANELYLVLPLMQEFDKANQLDEINLSLFAKRKSLYGLSDLLHLLNRANISVDHELFKSICLKDYLHYLIDISKILIEPNPHFLNKENFSMLLTQDPRFYVEKKPLLELLQAGKILNEEKFKLVCSKKDLNFFEQILEILSGNGLLKTNEILVNKLLNNEYDNYQFYKLMSYLNKSHILNQEIIDIFLKLNANTKHAIFGLVADYEKANFYINEKAFKAMLLLSERNIQRLDGFVSRLAAVNMLNQVAFESALQRVTLKLPQVEESTSVKKSRRSTNLPRSEITIDSRIRFFTEHSKTKGYERGGGGKIKKGYDAPDVDNPVYGIKKLLKSDPLKSQQEAIREVKFHRLLGREAFYFSKAGKTSIVAEWQHEKGLHHFKSSDIMQEPFEKRLQCLISGLTDVNVLHAHYRVHADVKCENFILDLKNATMRLIDFGASHKKGSAKSFVETPAYRDHSAESKYAYSFCDDIYAMGIVTAHLFPELYSVTFDKGNANIGVIKKSDLTVAELAIVTLVNTMMNTGRRMRCTSEDALHFCQDLLSNLNCLNEMILKKITNASINRSNTTMEDVFREAMRASTR